MSSLLALRKAFPIDRTKRTCAGLMSPGRPVCPRLYRRLAPHGELPPTLKLLVFETLPPASVSVVIWKYLVTSVLLIAPHPTYLAPSHPVLCVANTREGMLGIKPCPKSGDHGHGCVPVRADNQLPF